jgi:membrane associated rhomboid family serine protease
MPKARSVEAKLKKMMAQLNHGRHLTKPQFKEASRLSTAQKTDRNIRHNVTHWQNRFLIPLEILAIPWTQEILDTLFFQGRWNLVVYPRSAEGIPGIFLSAFSHSGWGHLMGNSIAFAIFSWLILAKSTKDFWITFVIGWIGGGFACWLLGPQAAHGLSGVVYTLFGYLLAIGWLEKRFLPLLISAFVMINFSYFVWGVFPTDSRIAWWGHLFGFLLGVFSAYGVYREPKQHI